MLKRLLVPTEWARTMRRNRALGIFLAVLASLIGVGIKLAMGPYLVGFPFITLFAAILATAFFAGFWPSILTTLLGAVMVQYWLMPESPPQPSQHVTWVPMAFFISTGILITILMESVFKAHDERMTAADELGRLNGELDALVVERTRQLESEIEERREAEARLHQAEKMDSIGQLTGGIAHDFNNMLAIITGSLELARRRLAPSEDSRVLGHLENAASAAERAAALTHRLLAFARKQPLDPRPLDVNELVMATSSLLTRTLGEQIVIDTQLDQDVWQCMADQTQLETSIINLSINARDAMPDGGQLTIETANTSLDRNYCKEHEDLSPGDYVQIAISDTGMGMSPEVKARALDPFFTTKEIGKGTGLGLSQVYGFAKQSHGHLNIYSELGRGTTIKLYLPRFSGTESMLPETSAGAFTLEGSQDIVVLVVEDDDGVRAMAKAGLQELGFKVLDANGAEQAYAVLDSGNRVDLLFTDIVMPGTNGRQLADRVRLERPDMKVLFTTGYTQNAIVHNGVIDSGVVLLVKPYTIDQLALKVQDALKLAR